MKMTMMMENDKNINVKTHTHDHSGPVYAIYSDSVVQSVSVRSEAEGHNRAAISGRQSERGE